MEEFEKCAKDFVYFCENYVKIHDWVSGWRLGPIIDFKIYDHQKRFIEHVENNRFSILNKYRLFGATTVVNIWFLWRAMFKTDERLMSMHRSDRMAVESSHIVKTAIKLLPEWLQPKTGKFNDHNIEFVETGSHISFYKCEAACSKSMDYIFLDETAFTKNMKQHWDAVLPTIYNGKAINVSTPNGENNWFHEVYTKSTNNENEWKSFDCHYKENPRYQSEEWEKRLRENLGEKGFRLEYLREFI